MEMPSLLTLLCSLLLTVSAQEDPCYRENLNCHRSPLLLVVFGNPVENMSLHYIALHCVDVFVHCLMFNWRTEVSGLWLMIFRSGENAIGTIPYFPDIWAAACWPAKTLLAVIGSHGDSDQHLVNQLIWGMRTLASSTATSSPTAIIRCQTRGLSPGRCQSAPRALLSRNHPHQTSNKTK